MTHVFIAFRGDPFGRHVLLVRRRAVTASAMPVDVTGICPVTRTVDRDHSYFTVDYDRFAIILPFLSQESRSLSSSASFGIAQKSLVGKNRRLTFVVKPVAYPSSRLGFARLSLIQI